MLGKKIPVTEEGKSQRVSVQRASFILLVNKALKGDIRALKYLLELARTVNSDDQTTAPETTPAAHQEILTNYLARQMRDQKAADEAPQIPADPNSDQKETE